MENVDARERWVTEDGLELVELDREEQLARLYEQLQAIEGTRNLRVGNTAATRHYRAFGHRLCVGCCARRPPASD